jgi:hypothetical protein
MAQKHQRGNREAKKPKQNKTKIVASVSPFAPPQQSKSIKGGNKNNK